MFDKYLLNEGMSAFLITLNVEHLFPYSLNYLIFIKSLRSTGNMAINKQACSLTLPSRGRKTSDINYRDD